MPSPAGGPNSGFGGPFKLFRSSNLRRGAKPTVRIAVLGQASAGKTALIVRYTTRIFIDDYAPEISKIHHHNTSLDLEEEVNMEIWDTAGHFQSQAEVRHLEIFIRWADVVVLVYSITDRASFNLVLQLLNQIDKIKPQKANRDKLNRGLSLTGLGGAGPGGGGGSGFSWVDVDDDAQRPRVSVCDSCPGFPIFLLGTKMDLWRDRQVSTENGLRASHEFSCIGFKEISTKDSIEQVDEVFEVALRQGWLFRQHREMTKHKNLTLYNTGRTGSSVSLTAGSTFPLGAEALASNGVCVADFDLTSQTIKDRDSFSEQTRSRKASKDSTEAESRHFSSTGLTSFLSSLKKVVTGNEAATPVENEATSNLAQGTSGYGNFLKSLPSAFKRRMSRDDFAATTITTTTTTTSHEQQHLGVPRRNRSKSIAGPASCEASLIEPPSIRLELAHHHHKETKQQQQLQQQHQQQQQDTAAMEQKYPKMKPRRKGSVFFALGTK